MSATTTDDRTNKEKPALLIGLGMWGSTWINVLNESEYWNCVGYVDLDEQKIEAAVQDYGVNRSNCYTDFDDAVSNTEAEAAVCVVPPVAHRDVAIDALEAGLDVLTEKPFAETISDAKDMIDKADRLGRNLMVSQNFRYKSGPRTVKKVLESGLVGQPEYINVNFQKAPVFEAFRLEMDSPLLLDMSIHHFDQMRYLLDSEPSTIYAKGANPSWSDFSGETMSSVTIETEDDVLINYAGSWDSRGHGTTWDGDWKIGCSDGEIDWSDSEVTVITQDPVPAVFQDELTEISTYGTADKGIMKADLVEMPCEARKYSLLEFRNSIDEDREPETSGKDNIKTLATVEAAIDSSIKNKEVDVTDIYK